MDASSNALEDDLVAARVAEYKKNLERGRSVDRENLLNEFPGIRDELNECLEALEMIVTITGPSPERTDSTVAPKANTLLRSISGQLGDFRLIRVLGRGGMGVVYEAEELSLGRHVALKVLPFAAMLDSRQLQRFRNEARAAATLKHPHIVGVHSVGFDRGVHFYTMELVEGQSIAELLESLRQVDQPTSANCETRPVVSILSTRRSSNHQEYYRCVARIGSEAADALHYAHRAGVVHRDIKPANLMLDSEGTVFITDFGLASFQGNSSLTMTGDILGTLRYMSPEQAAGKHAVVDYRTDVYSLGLTLYELLTLKPAFNASEHEQLVAQISGSPVSPRSHCADIPTDLETIVLKSISRDLNDRYETAHALAEDLRRFCEGRPVAARRPSWLVRTRSWLRRNRLISSLTAATLALLLCIAAYGSLTSIRLTKLASQLSARSQAQYRQVYDLEIAGAQRALEDGKIERCMELLDQHRPPQSGAPDIRGVEWRYLHGIAKSLHSMPRSTHWVGVTALACSPSGNLVAYGSRRGEVDICEGATMKKLGTILYGHDDTVVNIEFTADGKHLITSDRAGLLQVWDAEFTGRLDRHEVLQQEIDTGYRSIFALTRGRTEIVYSGVSGKEPAIFRSTLDPEANVGLKPETIVDSLQSQPQQLAISRDGARLGAIFSGGLAKAWDQNTNELIAEHQFPHDEATAIAFVPDNRDLVFISCFDQRHGDTSTNIWAWNLSEGVAERITVARGHCSTMSFADDGRFALGTSEGLLRVYDVETKGSATVTTATLNHLHSIKPHANEIACVRFSPDGQHLYSASEDNSVRKLELGKLPGTMQLPGHEGGTLDFRLLPDGSTIISGGADGTIREWDINTGELVRTF